MSNNDKNERHQGSPSTAEPKMCIKDCGFFGHEKFDGQCSKCYHEELQQQKQNSTSVFAQAASSENDQLEEDVGLSQVTFAKSPPEKGELSARLGPFRSSKKSTSSVSTSWKAKTEKLEKLSNFVAEGKDEGKQVSISKQNAKRPRCEKCGKSIEVIGFDCRCGHRFCVVHRHAAGHDCSFDYRAAGESELRKANPKVVADKIRKI